MSLFFRAAMLAAFLPAATQAAECALEAYDPQIGEVIELDLGGEIPVSVKLGEDVVGVSQGFGALDLESVWSASLWPSRILVSDINHDGKRELWVGRGGAGSNAFYAMIGSVGPGMFFEAGPFADPDFCEVERGFTTHLETSAGVTETWYDVNAMGQPWKAVEQKSIDGNMLLRTVYAEDGAVIQESTVPADAPLVEAGL